MSSANFHIGPLTGVMGTAIAFGEQRGLIAAALLLAAFGRKVRIEETWLVGIFGAAYEDYRHRVKAIIPFLVTLG